jgi:hypoxanthine phosphoribosyltransferase
VTDQPRFAHASEAELARILDYYGVRWQYEPRTFPILWNLDGAVVESFSPDFYLPELDLFIELTTLKQSLVRRKNRKLRRLRELYPDIRVKLFYGKDFKALMLKYGRFDIAASLSGLEGQALANSAVAPPPAELVAAATAGDGAAVPDAVPPAPVAALTSTSAARRRPSRGTRRRRARRRAHQHETTMPVPRSAGGPRPTPALTELGGAGA